MAIVKPFNGVRYDKENISKLICPPYDVISPAEKERLKGLAEGNMVRLELSDATAKRNKYQQAGALFKEWLTNGTFIVDCEPAYYFYEQSFTDHGKKMVRRGFFAALKVENPHGGSVKPHERTLAKPKEDRLKLIRAVKANLSPIFGLFHDKNKKVLAFSKKIAATRPVSIAKDKEGTTHKVWIVDNARDVAWIGKALAPQKIFIADGHHRYETAWNYACERAKTGKKDPAAEYNYVMIFLCPMEDPGLSIWPTHRVVTAPADFEKKVAEYFTVRPAAEFKKLSGKLPQPLLVYVNGSYRTLVLKDKKSLPKFMADKCAAYRNLGVSILHSILLAGVDPQSITYVKSEKEAVALAKERTCMAVMVPSTPIEAMKDIALANQAMPQKSTYFFPKVGSGIVVHAL